ncbi:MAG: hypothetical protein HYZ31_04580, partial [Gammaproteobacteria bacterium]|nr:hypothetical protein [Gammaproteobacteria bacterium]
GKVTVNDVANGDDTSGAAAYSNISNWTVFDHAWRTWGVDGTAFANSSNRGACAAGNCRIWDWSASTADLGRGTSPAVYNVVAPPTTSNMLSMVWTSTLATNQAYCDNNFPGSVWNGGTTCTTTYLRHSQEITGDNIGNDNGLCENGETCLYMPNIGSYQGHGALIAAGTVGTGLNTITLLRYQTLGR